MQHARIGTNRHGIRALAHMSLVVLVNFILHKAIIFDTYSLCKLYFATPQMLRCATVAYGSCTYTRLWRLSQAGHDNLL
jgi:hypothetical protein